MVRLFRLSVLLLALGVGLVLVGDPLSAADKEDSHAALIGKPAPDFKGDFALNGKPTSLSDLKGKVVLLDFWAVWCGPCVSTFPHLIEWNKEYKDKGLEVIGVTMYNFEFNRKIGFDKEGGKLKALKEANKDTEQAMLKEFAAHHKLDYRLMTVPRDEMKKVFGEYKVQGIPQVVLIDRKGDVRLVKVGSGEANAKAIGDMIKKLIAEK
jgi:thiol-disulfide isomerase/thioredoxin